MIILDTNVLSELMRQRPDGVVVGWLDRQPTESIWTTSVTVFEIRHGLELLAAGAKRRTLEESFEALVASDLENRVLDFDAPAAAASAALGALRQQSGVRMELRDLLIAGVALSRRGTLATRNVRHFEGTGVPLINPWPA